MTGQPTTTKSSWMSAKVRQAVWGSTSTRIRQSARLREPAIAAYRSLARMVLTGPPPKVLANSIPKSGTHLLTQLLGEVPKVWFSGVHVIGDQFHRDLQRAGDRRGEFDVEAFRRSISRIRDGQFMTSHLPVEPGAAETLTQLGFAHLLIVRDPRDIIVSRAFYLARNTRLPAQPLFAAMPDDAARLMAAIRGVPGTEGIRPVPSIGERLERYRPWLSDPSVCVVRFEDLVGPHGGGTEAAQIEAIRRVLNACRRAADDAAVRRTAGRIYAKHSATFRRGTIGDWRNHFTDEHLAALDEVAPGAVAAYGYER